MIKLFLIFTLIYFAHICYSEDVPQKICKEKNEYCQNHWECCSNLCMSYLYKCTAKRADSNEISTGSINLTPNIGTNAIQGITLEQLLENIYNAPPINTLPASVSAQINNPVNNVLDKRFGETTVETETTVEPETSSKSQEPVCKIIGEKCYRNSQCCTQRCHGFLHQCVT